MAAIRYININDKTAEHKARLVKIGYEVEEKEVEFDAKKGPEKVLAITCEGVVEGTVDVSTLEAFATAVKELIAAKKTWTYKTRFNFGNGTIVFGGTACRKLGTSSCLVTKNPPKGKKTKAAKAKEVMDEIFADILG
jgi:hypothetical protein